MTEDVRKEEDVGNAMRGGSSRDVLSRLQTLYRCGVIGHVSDEQLLDRFVAQRDETGGISATCRWPLRWRQWSALDAVRTGCKAIDRFR